MIIYVKLLTAAVILVLRLLTLAVLLVRFLLVFICFPQKVLLTRWTLYSLSFIFQANAETLQSCRTLNGSFVSAHQLARACCRILVGSDTDAGNVSVRSALSSQWVLHPSHLSPPLSLSLSLPFVLDIFVCRAGCCEEEATAVNLLDFWSFVGQAYRRRRRRGGAIKCRAGELAGERLSKTVSTSRLVVELSHDAVSIESHAVSGCKRRVRLSHL